jgi:hypothetical protein
MKPNPNRESFTRLRRALLAYGRTEQLRTLAPYMGTASAKSSSSKSRPPIGIQTNTFSCQFPSSEIVRTPISGVFRPIPGYSSAVAKSTLVPVDPTFHPQSKSNQIQPNQTFDFFSGQTLPPASLREALRAEPRRIKLN